MMDSRLFKVILYSIAAVFGFLGFIGNMLIFVGFQTQAKKTSTQLLFQALAVADNLVIFTTVSATLGKSIYDYVITIDHDIDLRILQAYYHMLQISEMSILGSILVTVLLATTRVIAVYYPLRASRICSIARIRLYLGFIVTYAIACNIPLHFTNTITTETISNTTYLIVDINRGVNLFDSINKIIMFTIAPLLIVTIASILLIVKLRSLEKRRRDLTSHQQKSNNATRLISL